MKSRALMRWSGGLALALLCGGGAAADRDPSCKECGVITSVREIQTERASASTITESLPPVGPVFGFTFGHDQPTKAFVGAVGDEQMRQRLTEISYEVIVRYNDGRYGLVETRYGADLRVGDPVKVIQNQIQLDI